MSSTYPCWQYLYPFSTLENLTKESKLEKTKTKRLRTRTNLRIRWQLHIACPNLDMYLHTLLLPPIKPIYSPLSTYGYHHITLSPETKKIYTFVTSFGKFELKKVPFGLAQFLANNKQST